MDSYLTEIKQLRIPRPKYEPNGSPPSGWHHYTRPYTPPQDYQLPTQTGGELLSSGGGGGGAQQRRKEPSSGE